MCTMHDLTQGYNVLYLRVHVRNQEPSLWYHPHMQTIKWFFIIALLAGVALTACSSSRTASSSAAIPVGTTSPVPTSAVSNAAPSVGTSADATQQAFMPLVSGAPISTTQPPVFSYNVINTYPHDPQAFTQGLVIDGGTLYEGTGQYGRSTLRRVQLETGEVLQQHMLPANVFGEGITVFGNRIVQLTWQSHLGYVYDRASFAELQTFTYPTEGWGITDDGKQLIMSDGTATLRFLDPQTFTELRAITVSDPTGPIHRLNELEYIDGQIYANVWMTDRIARIDPQTGNVTAWIDLTGLLSPADRTPETNVLNGIAYDADAKRLYVTGKLWPKLFEIKLVAQP